MDVAASEFYGSDKTYDLNFKEEASSHYLLLLYDIFIIKSHQKAVGHSMGVIM